MSARRLARALAVAAAAAGPAHAAHPLLTEDTGTQGQGRFQLELTADRTRDQPPGQSAREVLGGTVLSVGIADAVDLQLGLPWLRVHAHDAAGHHADRGLLDASLDLKWRFYEHGPLSLGFKPGITVPSGDAGRGFGAGRAGAGALLILSWAPGPLAVHSHAGYRRNENTVGQRTSLGHLSAAVTWEVSERLKLVADASADTDPDRGSRASVRYAILGLIYSVTPDFDLDFGIKHGLGEPAIDHSILVGAALRW